MVKSQMLDRKRYMAKLNKGVGKSCKVKNPLIM